MIERINKNVNKKKVLVFSTAYYPFVGGAEVAIKEITDRICGSYEFDLITAKIDKKLPDFEKIGQINVYRVGVGRETLDKLLLPFRGAKLAWDLSNKKKYFCIWGMMVTFGTGAGYLLNIARFFSRKDRIPTVLTLQEGDSENHLNYKWGGLIAFSWKTALRMTDKLTGISNFLIKRALRNGYKKETYLVPNGVDLGVFTRQFSEQEKSDLRILLDKKPDDVFLVTSGRLTHKNAPDDVIRALVHMPKRVQFIIIGKGEDGMKLQKLADSLGLGSRVKFLGFLSHKDIPRYFSICDIFIRPSRSEGFGNSFIEAMASCLPVIATPVGGIPDFIDDKETGVFCAPDNPQSIAIAVNSLINDNNLRTRVIRKAFVRVNEKYSWNHVANQMKAVFDSIN